EEMRQGYNDSKVVQPGGRCDLLGCCLDANARYRKSAHSQVVVRIISGTRTQRGEQQLRRRHPRIGSALLDRLIADHAMTATGNGKTNAAQVTYIDLHGFFLQGSKHEWRQRRALGPGSASFGS